MSLRRPLETNNNNMPYVTAHARAPPRRRYTHIILHRISTARGTYILYYTRSDVIRVNSLKNKRAWKKLKTHTRYATSTHIQYIHVKQKEEIWDDAATKSRSSLHHRRGRRH